MMARALPTMIIKLANIRNVNADSIFRSIEARSVISLLPAAKRYQVKHSYWRQHYQRAGPRLSAEQQISISS